MDVANLPRTLTADAVKCELEMFTSNHRCNVKDGHVGAHVVALLVLHMMGDHRLQEGKQQEAIREVRQ